MVPGGEYDNLKKKIIKCAVMYVIEDPMIEDDSLQRWIEEGIEYGSVLHMVTSNVYVWLRLRC